MADVQQEARTPVSMFKLDGERVWHVYKREDLKALCGARPDRAPGAGTMWTVLEAQPTPMCKGCAEEGMNT